MKKKDNRPEQAAELRRQAEEITRGSEASSQENIEALSPEEIRQTLHELRVHRIELEMQNEELRRARVELEAARERYFDLYDLAPVGYCTLSEKGLILEANLTAATMLGVARGALDKWPFSRFILKEDQGVYYLHHKRLFETDMPQVCEIRMQIQDGKTFWARLESTVAQDAEGISTCRTVISDITDRKLAEQELRTSEMRFRAFFENAAVGTAELNPEGRFLQVNSRLCQMTGYTAEELLRMTPFDLSPPEDAQHDQEALNAYLHGNMPAFDSVRRYRQKSGNIIWVQVTAAMIRDANAEPLRSVGVIIDITERKRAEEALNQQSAKLGAANQELESFSYSVSHDLRAPLRAIDGYARMILRQQGDKFDENTKRQFDVIRDNAQRMGQLIDDILAFSRLGRQSLSVSRLNLEELTKEVWEEMKTIESAKSMNLKIDHILPGTGNRSLIKQVIINLLSNAVKFSRAREVPHIEVGGYDTESEIVYYIMDNGVGFDMKYHDKLFGVFQRLHSDEEYEGTGIGLALVQRIINLHGGRVWAEGELDKGATFYFTLPHG